MGPVFRYLVLFIAFQECTGQIELDDRFLEYRNQGGAWLVQFYAPWCGHCKKLEPVYREVARELQARGTGITVAKVDSTRYSALSSEFSVRGFPTIMFIKGDQTFTHRGARTKEDITEFALRAMGPTVRKLNNVGKFNKALGDHSDSVFFLYVGEDDENDDLFKKYSETADTHAIQAYFYAGRKSIIGTRKIKKSPTVLVFKDDKYYELESSDGEITASALSTWVNRERYAAFPAIVGAGLNDMVSAAKWLVILAVDDDDMNEASSESSRLHKMLRYLAFNKRDTYHESFQFVYMREMETLNNLAIAFLSAPALMVFESDTQLYYLAPLPDKTDLKSLQNFLDRVSKGEEQAYGGTGLSMRIKRVFYDIVSTVLSIWQASRWLFLLMFGLPTCIISIVCYSLCCMETIDDMPEDSDLDSDEEAEDQDMPPLMPASERELPPYEDVQSGVDPKDPEDKKNE